MPVTANPYFTLCSDFDPPPMKKCKICEVEGTRMGSIVCAADDQRTLDRIFAMTNIRARPVFGIISPVCDECRERIDMYDEGFEPQVRDLLLQDLDAPVIIEEYDPLVRDVYDSKNLSDTEAWEENFEHDPSDPIPSFVERQVTIESSEYVEDLPETHGSCEPAPQSMGDSREPMQDAVPSRETQVEEPAGISDSKNLILVDDPKQIFKNMCPICAKQCKSLKSHIKIHVRKGLYVCVHCRAKFKTRSLLAYHNATHTHRPFGCNLCSKTYRTVFTLKAHMKQHSRTPAFQCELCPKAFNSDTCWKIHIRAHKGEKPFPCSICGTTFGTPYNRKVHEMRHQNKRDYQCDKCPKGFFTPKELRTHQIRHIKVGLRTFPQITEQLQQVGKAKEELLSKAEGFINDHLYETVEKQCPKQFSCSSCYKSFHDKSQLRLHEKRRHSAASLGKSNVRFPKIDREAAEKQMASIIYSDTSFVCDVCARSFQSGRGLRQHLYVHIRGVKVHRCSRCPKVFFQVGHLQEHELTHTGQKPFSCPVCGRCFNRNYIMERHRREQHPDEIIPDGSQESNPENEPLIVDLNGQVATNFALHSVGIATRAMYQRMDDVPTLKVDGVEPTNETDTIAASPKKVRKKVRFSDVLEVEYFNADDVCHVPRIPKSSNRPGILKGSLKKDKGSLKPPPETCAVPMVHPTPATSTGLDMDTVAPEQQNSSISESAFTLQEAEEKVNPELSLIDAMNSSSTLQEADTIFESELSGIGCMNSTSTMLEDEASMKMKMEDEDSMNSPSRMEEDETIFESELSGIECMNSTSGMEEDETIFESELSGTECMNSTSTMQEVGTIFEPELNRTECMNSTSTLLEDETIVESQLNGTVSSPSTMLNDETIVESELNGTDSMNSPSTMLNDETIVESELNGIDSMNSPSTMLDDETIVESQLNGTVSSPSTMQEDETIVDSELSGAEYMNCTSTMQEVGTIFEPELSRTDSLNNPSTMQEDVTIVEPELSPIHSANSAESDEPEEQNSRGLLLELEITPAFDWRHRINTDLWEILGVPTSLSMLHEMQSRQKRRNFANSMYNIGTPKS